MKWFFEKSSVEDLTVVIQNPDYTKDVSDLVGYLEAYENRSKGIISVKTVDDIAILKVDKIRAIEVEGDYLRIYDGKRQILTRDRLYRFQEKMGHPDMVQVSKHSVINIQYLEKMEASFSGNMTAFLRDGLKITVSRRYLKALEKHLGL